jgi:hypothetical protein
MSKDPYTYDETSMIFDWDDTLLPSSWLAQNGLTLDAPIPIKFTAQLTKLEVSVSMVLERALITGTVIIITNSEAGWVDLSCRKFIPSILPLLCRIKIISARSTFEHIFVEAEEWKLAAFAQEIPIVFLSKPEFRKNIISFGDSIHERKALFKIAENLKLIHPKSIKFVERPTIDQLQRQLDLVGNHIFEICKKTETLDLMLTIQILYST